MSIIKFFITISLLFSVSHVYSDDYPLIYISPNPNKINIDMHASNVEVI